MSDKNMPTGKQIRAARVLLEWDASNLAAKVGMRRETILSIEKELSNPRPLTIEKILHAFEKEGIEFLDHSGVRLKDDTFRVIEGENPYLKLLDDVYYTLFQSGNPEALFFFVDNSKSPPSVVASHNRIRSAGIKCRYLCHEKAKRLDFPVDDYRAISDEFFHNNISIIYGDKYATMILDPDTGKDNVAIIIRNPHIAASQRNLFNLIWSTSKKVKT